MQIRQLRSRQHRDLVLFVKCFADFLASKMVGLKVKGQRDHSSELDFRELAWGLARARAVRTYVWTREEEVERPRQCSSGGLTTSHYQSIGLRR